MPEPAIIDTSVITVKSTTKNTYGDLIVTPTEGEDIKVGVKREQYFDVFQQGRAVKLFWAEYMHKKYVAKAELFDGKPPEAKRVEPITAGKGVEPLKTYAPQEIGMWYNNLGNRIGDGSLARDYPKAHVKIAAQYYKKMSEVLGIDFKSES